LFGGLRNDTGEIGDVAGGRDFGNIIGRNTERAEKEQKENTEDR
jgi:hypothetical protein